MNKQSGFSLIELVIFIVVLGIAGVAIVSTFVVSGTKAPSLQNQSIAIELAQERMDLILGQRAINGFSSFSDPCPGPSICTAPSGFTVSSSIANNWNGDTAYKVITVTVSGNGNASLQALVANY
jgi:type II secretory pathway pseudopilin PulG